MTTQRPDIEAIEMRLKAATLGTWYFYELGRKPADRDGLGYIRCAADNLEIAHHGDARRSPEENRANAGLIFNAPTDLRALVDYVRSLEARATAAEAEVERLKLADEQRARDISRLTIERDEARDRIQALELALRMGAAWFREYEIRHREKGATEKADRNKDRAEFLESAPTPEASNG